MCFALMQRKSNVDHDNWIQLIDVDNLHIDSSNHLAWGNGGHSTSVTDIIRTLNMVTVYTRSGANYTIVFPLLTHGKAEWKKAQNDAAELYFKLSDQRHCRFEWR